MENIKVMSVEEIRREISEKYPAFKDGELEALGLKCIGGSSDGGVYFKTNSGSKIDVYMGYGKEHGTIRMSNPDDKKEFDDNFLRDTAIRILGSRHSAIFPLIYRYMKYIKPQKDREVEKK